MIKLQKGRLILFVYFCWAWLAEWMNGWMDDVFAYMYYEYMLYVTIRIVNQNNWYISLPSIIEQTQMMISLSLFDADDDPNYSTKFYGMTNVTLI